MDVILEGTARNGGGLRERLEGFAGGVVPAGSEIGLLMQPAVHPEGVLAVPDAEGFVVAERAVGIPRFRPVDREVALPRRWTDLQVVVHASHALTFHRRGQERQGHGRLQDAARLHHVVEEQAGLGLLPEDLEDGHAGPPVRTGVVDEHEGQRREVAAGGDVEVVTQGPSLAADHQRVLLVGIVADGCRVVLVVDGALGLETIQPARAGVARQHNLTRLGRILDRVSAEDRRPRHRVQARLDQRGVAPEPPDLQRVASRNGVDGEDGGTVGGLETCRERVLVGARMVRAAGSDETGKVIGASAIPGLPGGRQHPLTDIHGPDIDAGGLQGGRQRQAS